MSLNNMAIVDKTTLLFHTKYKVPADYRIYYDIFLLNLNLYFFTVTLEHC